MHKHLLEISSFGSALTWWKYVNKFQIKVVFSNNQQYAISEKVSREDTLVC